MIRIRNDLGVKYDFVWLMGIPFLQAYYSIYDMDNHRVGLGRVFDGAGGSADSDEESGLAEEGMEAGAASEAQGEVPVIAEEGGSAVIPIVEEDEGLDEKPVAYNVIPLEEQEEGLQQKAAASSVQETTALAGSGKAETKVNTAEPHSTAPGKKPVDSEGSSGDAGDQSEGSGV